jgi:hypothetical protein
MMSQYCNPRAPGWIDRNRSSRVRLIPVSAILPVFRAFWQADLRSGEQRDFSDLFRLVD